MSGIEKSSGEMDGGLEPPTTAPKTITKTGGEPAPEGGDALDAVVKQVRSEGAPAAPTAPAAPAAPTAPADPIAPPADPSTAPVAAPVVPPPVDDDPLDHDPWKDIDALDETWRTQLAEFDRIIQDARGYSRLQQPLDDPEMSLLERWAKETGTPLTVGARASQPSPAAPQAPAAPTAVPQVPSDPNNVMGFLTQMRETVTGLQRDLATERQERAEEKRRLLTEQRDEKLKRQRAQFSAAALASGAPEDVHDLLFTEASRIRNERPTLRDKPVREVLDVLREQYPSMWTGKGAPKAPATPTDPAPAPEDRKGERTLTPRRKRGKPTGDQPPPARRVASRSSAPPSSLSEAAKSFKERAAKEL